MEHLTPTPPDRIHPSAIIHPRCRILGADTSIGPDCEIGAEGPVTLKNCQLGEGVTVRGGYLENATLLDGVDCGSGTHIRPGTLLEEYASIAHTDGLKQTILMPYVTMGSLINFCDVLMAGGTGKTNHSEVGSSYIHFNFTPHQDKATASLVGDVPRGVLINQKPIFLGGQGGLVGPTRIAYGTVVAAGLIVRKDIETPNQLVMSTGSSPNLVMRPYNTEVFSHLDRIIANNLLYIGNLRALRLWYRHVRMPFLTATPWGKACFDGALARLDEGLDERLKRLAQLCEKASLTTIDFDALKHILDEDLPPPASVVTALPLDKPYLDAIRSLSSQTQTDITAWLQSAVEMCVVR